MSRVQAAEENALGIQSQPHMTVELRTVVSSMEVSLIQTIALPIWKALARSFPALNCAVLRMQLNSNLYHALSKLQEDEVNEVHTPFVKHQIPFVNC